MKKTNLIAQIVKTIFITLMILVATSALCSAQEWSRKGKGEIFALGQYMGGDTISYPAGTAEIDDTVAGGFGVGYNFNDHLNLNTGLFFGSTNITTKRYETKWDANLSGADINLDINMLKSRFTPMITGGVGFINFKGDSFDETDFSYNAGAGFRWDISNHLFMKAIYKATWTKLKDADNTVLLDGATLSIGYIF